MYLNTDYYLYHSYRIETEYRSSKAQIMDDFLAQFSGFAELPAYVKVCMLVSVAIVVAQLVYPLLVLIFVR